jgi:hypothetical protein
MNRRGNIVVALLFMLLLAVSGLALLTHTGAHLQVVAARRERRLGAAALGQALLLSLHRFRARLAASDMNACPEPERDFFNEAVFPAQKEDGILSRHSFSRLLLRDAGDFRVTRLLDLIRASKDGGRLAGSARAGVDLVSGDIPVGECDLLIGQETAMAPDAFLAARGVAYAGALLPQVSGHAVEIDARGMLAEALGLAGEVPDWRRIRAQCGLEPSDAPLAPGVYLAREEGTVPAVFVEGDLQKLVFSAAGGWQTIGFSQGGRSSELRYRPGEGSLAWSGSGDVAGARFGEKIIVHGSVWAIEQAGLAAFLAAARIELLASGRLVVRSGLEGDSLELGKERIPGLLLMTCGRDFFTGEDVAADVIIDVAGPTTIQAQVVSAGTLVNGAFAVTISGSLFARDIENDGKLQVGAAAGDFVLADRVLAREFKLLRNFRVHFIEENGDEE